MRIKRLSAVLGRCVIFPHLLTIHLMLLSGHTSGLSKDQSSAKSIDKSRPYGCPSTLASVSQEEERSADRKMQRQRFQSVELQYLSMLHEVNDVLDVPPMSDANLEYLEKERKFLCREKREKKQTSIKEGLNRIPSFGYDSRWRSKNTSKKESGFLPVATPANRKRRKQSQPQTRHIEGRKQHDKRKKDANVQLRDAEDNGARGEWKLYQHLDVD
mmetsp:Transcript_12777/g.17875  ORF Transcript_12777/g.17875 Transcript_12777/m.17875 type:complete len:215 (+) Transcript_12777:98-742(+)